MKTKEEIEFKIKDLEDRIIEIENNKGLEGTMVKPLYILDIKQEIKSLKWVLSNE